MKRSLVLLFFFSNLNLNAQDSSKVEYIKLDSLGGEELYSFLLKENQNKLIYVNIWGTWCEPCISEIPPAIELQEQFKGEDIAFIYLCGKCKIESLLNVLKEKNWHGKHILLTQLQLDYFQMKLNRYGFPTYFLIDKKGEIVKKEFLSPRDSNSSLFIKELLK